VRKLINFKAPILFVCALLVSLTAIAQKKAEPIASPRDSVSGVVAGSHISVNYGSPAVKKRKIWGGLVPYNKIWRTGANPATVFTTSKAIKVEGKALKAGKYSLFTIPGEKEWTIIFNSETGQWGIKDDYTTNDNPKKDVLKVSVKPMKAKAFSERMKFKIDKGFVLVWENLAVPVKIN
jgi:hypothetical protein